MNKTVEKPKGLEEAFTMLEQMKAVEVKSIDAVRILQNTLTDTYKIYFNIPSEGMCIIIPQSSIED